MGGDTAGCSLQGSRPHWSACDDSNARLAHIDAKGHALFDRKAGVLDVGEEHVPHTVGARPTNLTNLMDDSVGQLGVLLEEGFRPDDAQVLQERLQQRQQIVC